MRRALGLLPSKSSVFPTQLTQPRTQGQRLGRTRPKGPGVSPPTHTPPADQPVPPALTAPLLLSAPACSPLPRTTRAPFPRGCVGARKVRSRNARGSGGPETPEAAASPRLGGGSARGAGRALAPQHGPSLRTPLPPGFGGTRREGTGINTLTLWLRLTGTATPGRLGHWAARPRQVPGQAGRAPPPDWLTGRPSPGPSRRLIGCAAQMTSSSLSEKPAGRPLCSPEPIALVGGLTSPPAGPRGAPRGVNALAAGAGPESRAARGGGARARPGAGDRTAPRHHILPLRRALPPALARRTRSQIDPVILQLSVRLRDEPAPLLVPASGRTGRTNPTLTLTLECACDLVAPGTTVHQVLG